MGKDPCLAFSAYVAAAGVRRLQDGIQYALAQPDCSALRALVVREAAIVPFGHQAVVAQGCTAGDLRIEPVDVLPCTGGTARLTFATPREVPGIALQRPAVAAAAALTVPVPP